MNTTIAAEIRTRRRNMTQAEMLADMEPAELARNIHRGGIAAIEEQERRDNFFQIASSGTDLESMTPCERREQEEDREAARFGRIPVQILPDLELDIGV